MRKIFKTSPAKDYKLTASPVFSATVVEVDVENYTMRVRSKYMSGISKPLDIPAMFYNVRDPSGAIVGAIPERGCEVWLCRVADAEDEYIPLCYKGVVGDGGYKGARPDVEPGDVILSTSDSNYIHVSKGGTVSLSASPTCTLHLNPVDDTLYTMCSSVKEYTVSHSFETFCDEGRRVATLQKYYEIAEQKDPSVEVHVGYTGSNTVYSMKINSYSPDASILVSAGRDGSLSVIGHDTNIELDQTVITTNDLTITAESTDEYSGNILVTASDVHALPSLMTVGEKASSDYLLKNDQLTSDLNTLLSALDAHSAAVASSLNSVGFPVAVTLAPLTTSIQAIKTSIASGVYSTNKLKSE